MQIFSQGIDIPALDIIINACANRTKIGVLQSIGRVMRKSRNKEYGTYYDFYDVGSDYFLQATKDRINILRKFGHEIEYLKLKE
jgi:superfamily II DNA or RNA helicase